MPSDLQWTNSLSTLTVITWRNTLIFLLLHYMYIFLPCWMDDGVYYYCTSMVLCWYFIVVLSQKYPYKTSFAYQYSFIVFINSSVLCGVKGIPVTTFAHCFVVLPLKKEGKKCSFKPSVWFDFLTEICWHFLALPFFFFWWRAMIAKFNTTTLSQKYQLSYKRCPEACIDL